MADGCLSHGTEYTESVAFSGLLVWWLDASGLNKINTGYGGVLEVSATKLAASAETAARFLFKAACAEAGGNARFS